MKEEQQDTGVPAASQPSGQRPSGVEPVPGSSKAATPNAGYSAARGYAAALPHLRAARRAFHAAARGQDEPHGMSDAQIDHMLDRFLTWFLPDDFNPDNGISFDPLANAGSPFEMKREPAGTNLFSARQATAMVRHMVEGMPGIMAAPTPSDRDCIADLQLALVDHNDALRSACQVAKRGGEATNWEGLTESLEAVLAKHHRTSNRARAAVARGEPL